MNTLKHICTVALMANVAEVRLHLLVYSVGLSLNTSLNN